MRLGLALISAQLVVVVLLLQEAQSLPMVPDYVKGAKNYLAGLVRNGLISRSTMASSFNDTISIIKERYNQAKLNGEIDPNDDTGAASDYLYRIVIEEVKNLREKIQADTSGKLAKGIAKDSHVDESLKKGPSAQDGFLAAVSNLNDNIPEGSNYDQLDMDMDDEDDLDSIELSLENQLNAIDAELSEAEMGWSIDPTAVKALRDRTQTVLTDMMQNELRQLALTVASCYITGGSVGAATSVVRSNIMFKLVQYFVNAMLDALAIIMGKRIEITPSVHVLSTEAPMVVTPATEAPTAPLSAPESQKIEPAVEAAIPVAA